MEKNLKKTIAIKIQNRAYHCTVTALVQYFSQVLNL